MAPKPFRAGCVPGLVAEAKVLQYPLVSESRSDHIGVLAIDALPDEGRDLLLRYREGDALAFDLLMRLYRAPIYGFFRRSGASVELADDLFQDTFLRVHAHADQYTPNRPFRVWLFTIAHNLMRSHWRKAAVRRFLVGWLSRDDEPLDVPDPQPGPEDKVSTAIWMRWLETALQRLPERHRQALVLTQIEGLSLEEAADVMGVPVATVKTWVHRGRQSLAQARRSHEGESK